jgi:hypothetical protein
VGRGASTAVALILGIAATACVPVDDFGPLFWVENQSGRTVYAASESGAFNPFPVPAGSLGQGNFIGEGTEISVVDDRCVVLGQVILMEDVTIRVAQTLEITTTGRPSEEARLLDQVDGLEVPGCTDVFSENGD